MYKVYLTDCMASLVFKEPDNNRWADKIAPLRERPDYTPPINEPQLRERLKNKYNESIRKDKT